MDYIGVYSGILEDSKPLKTALQQEYSTFCWGSGQGLGLGFWGFRFGAVVRDSAVWAPSRGVWTKGEGFKWPKRVRMLRNLCVRANFGAAYVL